MASTILGSKDGTKFLANGDDLMRSVNHSLGLLARQLDRIKDDPTGHAIAFNYIGDGALTRQAYDMYAVYAMVSPPEGGEAELQIIDHYWNAAEVEEDPNWIENMAEKNLGFAGRIENRYRDIFGLAYPAAQISAAFPGIKKRVYNMRGECFIFKSEAEAIRDHWIKNPMTLEESKQRRLEMFTHMESELKQKLPMVKAIDKITRQDTTQKPGLQ